MALQDRTPRPGLVLEVDRSTPPILFHRGEGFSLEHLPPGRSRILYPAEPLNPLPDPDGAIRDALLNPMDEDPLPSKLFKGMKLTIVFDDISLPLPQMRRPDIRQRIIEQVLDMAAEANVDDVHIIAALALHRRMTEDELRHAVGDRVYDAFAPSGLLYNMDAEDPDEMVMLGETSEGEEVQMVRRGRRKRPGCLRQHQHGVDEWRLEEHRHRPVWLQGHPPPSQCRHLAQVIADGPHRLGVP